ncbi:MAG TPA: hypothetical protein VK510_08810 [Solirubrobacteraceae bacterium]|jgi:hypothetical protein|nr:hypothetical protein [Solirubrobacteraceae bacterium]
MTDMDTQYNALPPLQAIFDAARHFGLTADEIWTTLDESLSESGGDATVIEYLDECAGALAVRILAKHRGTAR